MTLFERFTKEVSDTRFNQCWRRSILIHIERGNVIRIIITVKNNTIIKTRNIGGPIQNK
jgi:hypothetical protein